MSQGAEKKVDHAPTSLQDVQSWVEEHGDYLYRYCLRHIRNESQAEDMVQETFLAAVRSHSTFVGNSSVRTWLTAILRNKVIDRMRQKQKDAQVSYDELESEKLSAFFDDVEHWRAETGPREWNLDPETAIANREFMQTLESCLQKLPEKYRSIFTLREIDDLSREEIAESLDIKPNNVGVILHRARIQLRECLQVNWLDEGGTK